MTWPAAPRLRPPRPSAVGHVRAFPLHGDNEPLVTQEPDRLANRVTRDAVLAHQGRLRRQWSAGGELPGRDRGPEQSGQLTVDGDSRLMIKHLTRVNICIRPHSLAYGYRQVLTGVHMLRAWAPHTDLAVQQGKPLRDADTEPCASRDRSDHD